MVLHVMTQQIVCKLLLLHSIAFYIINMNSFSLLFATCNAEWDDCVQFTITLVRTRLYLESALCY